MSEAALTPDAQLGLSYVARRERIETYFDHTALQTWAQLTSDKPVSKIRATVRAGRETMHATLLSWLPADLSDRRVLDAGCGSGALAVEAAGKGAQVVAVDVSAGLIDLARSRAPSGLKGSIDFRVGDMLSPAHGQFDHAVAMDSLIHYDAADVVRALAALSSRVHRSIVFTFAPKTLPLTIMHTVGLLFPRGDRAPAIVPVAESDLRARIAAHPDLSGWRVGRKQHVSSGFYKSQAMELVRP